MRSSASRGLVAALATAGALAVPHGEHKWTLLQSRQDLAQTYDYIVIGGGTAGLTVADRLTEDGVTTVLVIEHGGMGTQLIAVTTP